jgi:hypothetical protein
MNRRLLNRRDRMHWLVEWRLVPLLLALAVGVMLGQCSDERLLAEQAQALKQAHADLRLAAAVLAQWEYACTPLLTMPVHSTPELLDVDWPVAASGAAR